LTAAIQKQIEQLQKADEDAINANLKKVEEWKNERIEAINAEYDARLEAIQKELDLLDQSEQEKTRAEEDAEYERKKNRLQALIDYEHDAVNRANYQKELERLNADYQKTLDKRILEDKKKALEEERDLIKTQQDELVSAIEEEASKRTEILNDQLTEVEQYYSERSDRAQQMAEQLLIDAKNNQDTILNLLKDYGDAYEITGQSLGEKLAQGINDGLANNITDVIQTIQDTIDRGIENKIKELSSGSYDYAKDVGQAGGNKIINVTQNNTFEQMQEMPSETYRKLNNTSQDLAAELAGM
jgi:DNA repair exonuclease SbcCD ATPase subunit